MTLVLLYLVDWIRGLGGLANHGIELSFRTIDPQIARTAIIHSTIAESCSLLITSDLVTGAERTVMRGHHKGVLSMSYSRVCVLWFGHPLSLGPAFAVFCRIRSWCPGLQPFCQRDGRIKMHFLLSHQRLLVSRAMSLHYCPSNLSPSLHKWAVLIMRLSPPPHCHISRWWPRMSLEKSAFGTSEQWAVFKPFILVGRNAILAHLLGFQSLSSISMTSSESFVASSHGVRVWAAGF